jgi:predicted nuclease of restriction endonuclease-like (RecB) superfamily
VVKPTTITSTYPIFLKEILEKIQAARYQMLKTVSLETVKLYWNIGRIVSQKVEQEKWGKSVVERLSKDLQVESPGIRGFSVRNIWNMKSFYETYADNIKLQPLVAEIGWVQNCIIIEKCKNELEREFYIRQTKLKGWSKLDLIEKIKQKYYQKGLLIQNNFERTVPEELKARVAWEFVDDYNIELINPDQPISEKDLENVIIKNILNFLQEMGGNFAFIGRQYRIEFEEKEYFIDLLFFNLQLNCYVVFELKAREFDPRDMGQLQMYMTLINKEVKQKNHNPTIGIIICRKKNRMVVEYMLGAVKEPVGVATYNSYSELPKKFAKYLPSESEIIKRLSKLSD